MELLPKPPHNGLDFAKDIIVKPAVRSSVDNFEVSPSFDLSYLWGLEPVLIVTLSVVCAYYLTVSLEHSTLVGQ